MGNDGEELFTVVINPHTPLTVQAGYGVYLAFATGLWFCLVALLFSQAQVRSGFARMGHWFDRVMGDLDECDLVFADPDNGLTDDDD